MTFYVRRNRRAIYRAIRSLEGWHVRAEIVAAAERIRSSAGGYDDTRSQIRVVAATRRGLVLTAY